MPISRHNLVGAQVLQAQLAGKEVFYLSPLSMTPPVRGGVPVLFPQFNDVGPLAKHGMVRTAKWDLAQDKESAMGQALGFSLSMGAGDHADWPHAAHLSLQVNATPDSLVFALRVTNTGNDSFDWTGGLHPYFAVQDLLASAVRGLEGLSVRDRFDPTCRAQPPGDLRWTDAPFERLFDSCPALRLGCGSHALRLSATGFNQWMVWNPGSSGGGALKDLPAGDWRRFVCIEPVCVSRPVKLLPGMTFEGQLQIEVSSLN